MQNNKLFLHLPLLCTLSEVDCISNKGFLFCSNANAVGDNTQLRRAMELLFSWEDQRRQKSFILLVSTKNRMISELTKKIKDNWQLLATLLLMWSTFDLYNYYRPFEIEIQSYISISEILLLTFPAFINGLFAITIIVIVFTLGIRKRKKENDANIEKLIEAIDEHNSKLFHFKFYFKNLKKSFTPFKSRNIIGIIFDIVGIVAELGFVILILSIGYFVYTIFTSNSLEIYPLNTGPLFAIFFFITYFFLIPLMLLISDYFEKYAHPIFSILTMSKSPILYFAIGFIVNSVISNRVQYLSITNGKSNKKVSFTYSDKKIETDSNLVYIGSTQSYIFMRNNIDKSSIVVKKDEIKNLVVKKVF